MQHDQSLLLNQYIDHTLLRATASEEDIAQWCEEAVQYNFFSVCINSGYVKRAYKLLKKTPVKITSVVGFPLGAMSRKAKLCEVERAIHDGADEIDMVIQIGLLKSGCSNMVLKEIAHIKKTVEYRILKVIIETCYLTDVEKKLACRLAVDGGADFVKTSTGFGTGGATVADIVLMKTAVDGQARLKASGGIRDRKTAQQYIDLGVSRLGTSGSIAIVTGTDGTAAY